MCSVWGYYRHTEALGDRMILANACLILHVFHMSIEETREEVPMTRMIFQQAEHEVELLLLPILPLENCRTTSVTQQNKSNATRTACSPGSLIMKLEPEQGLPLIDKTPPFHAFRDILWEECHILC
jgi:hypothetical protein